MLGRFYGSIGNLLLESFGSDILYFKYIYTDHEPVQHHVRGQNSRSVDRDAISTRECIFLHKKLTLVFETDALMYKNGIITSC
jgi:hypothetical protein